MSSLKTFWKNIVYVYSRGLSLTNQLLKYITKDRKENFNHNLEIYARQKNAYSCDCFDISSENLFKFDKI